jgi:hypothetical protein
MIDFMREALRERHVALSLLGPGTGHSRALVSNLRAAVGIDAGRPHLRLGYVVSLAAPAYLKEGLVVQIARCRRNSARLRERAAITETHLAHEGKSDWRESWMSDCYSLQCISSFLLAYGRRSDF